MDKVYLMRLYAEVETKALLLFYHNVYHNYYHNVKVNHSDPLEAKTSVTRYI